MITIHNLRNSNSKKKKRIGRGNASGHGTYSTRGIKGQRSRSGGRSGLKLKGFKQILSSIPKVKGFKRQSDDIQIINLTDLNDKFSDNAEILIESLYKEGVIRSVKKGVKILGNGELKLKGLKINGCDISKSAREKVEKNGGEVKTN